MPTKAMLEKENAALRQRVAELERQPDHSQPINGDSERLYMKAKLFEAMLENIPVGIVITGGPPNFPIQWISRAGMEMTQRPADSLVGVSTGFHQVNWGLLLSDGVTRPRPEQMPLYRASRFGEQVRDEEFVLVTADQRHLTVLVDAGPIRDAEGRVIGAINSWRDITERKRSEQALRESEERFSRAFHGNPAVQIISRVDNGRIVDVNKAGCRLVGRDRDELIGRNAAELGFWADSAEQQQKIQQARRSGIHGPFEVNVQHSSGEIHTIMVTSEPVEFNGLDVLITTAIDITQRKKSEEALRESEQRFSSIFNYSPIAMVISRLSDGLMVDLNPAMQTLLGYSRAEMIGHTAAELQTWDSLPERQIFVEHLQTHKRVTNFETVARMKSGAQVNVLVSAQVVVIDQEELLLGEILDITERKRAEEALRQAHDELEMRVQQRTAELSQVNAALQASKATLLGFYDSAPFMMGVAELDGDKTVAVSANRATSNFLARQPKDLPGRTGIELGNPGDFEHLWVENYRRCQREGVPTQFEYKYPHASGERWLKANAAFIGIGASGNPRFSFVVEDITEHKHAEFQREAALEKQRESEVRLQQVLDSAQDVIFAIDTEYRFLVNNQRHRQALVESGGHLFQVGEDVLSPDYPPEVRSYWRAAYDRALNGDSIKMETKWPDASGQLHYSENNLEPLRNAMNEIVGVLVVVHDITESRRAEEALRQLNDTLEQRMTERTAELRESETRYRTIVEMASEGIVLARPQGGYYFVNQQMAKMLGYPVEEILGKSSSDFTFDDWQPEVHHKRNDLTRGDHIQGEFKFRRKDGSVLWSLYNAVPVFNEQGEHIANFAMHTDITDRKRIEQERENLLSELEHSHSQLQALSRQLIEAQEQERRTIGRELHDEIGQNLTGLKLLLEVGQRLPAEDNLAKLEQAQQVAGELIDRISALSLDLRPPMLDDLGLLPALLWFLERFTSQTNIQVKFQQTGILDRRFASALETAVYRLIQEALTNAARHARVSQVAVHISATETELELSIEDAGVGFDVPSVFAQAATGGLSGMRERVRLLGGLLEIDSAPGRGTLITVLLPVIQGQQL